MEESGFQRSRRRTTLTRCGNLCSSLLLVSHIECNTVGEQFEEPKVIGLGLSLRTKERLLQVWLKDGRNDKVRTGVSNKLRQILQLDPENVTLYYKEHQKSIKDQSTMKNAEGFKFMKSGDHQKNNHHHYNQKEHNGHSRNQGIHQSSSH